MMSLSKTQCQKTLARPVSCQGVGVHSGAPVLLTLNPAPEGSGIVFQRSDVETAVSLVPARFDLVTETTLGTTITNQHGTSVATIEHLVAALWGAGVDNVLISLNGPEVPIMDGSSEPFVFLVECAGLKEQTAMRHEIVIEKTIAVREGDSYAMVEPHHGFTLDIEIEFAHKAIGRQRARYDFSQVTFRQMLSRARTFGFESDVKKLRSMGLARGGSLDNAVVIGQKNILNEDGLRFRDEFVRHKALDCVGDYFLLNGRLQGAVTTSRPGHGINNKLMRAIMEELAAPVSAQKASIIEEPASLSLPEHQTVQ